jgi:hypothetical protein
MEFRVQFYRTETGREPVREFLDMLNHQQPGLHRLVTAGLIKLRGRNTTDHR